MSAHESYALLERQLLLQLGDRLKRLRKAQRLGTVELAARAGMTRNTLRAVESGDPAPSIGTYLRVMSILGVGGDLALLAGDEAIDLGGAGGPGGLGLGQLIHEVAVIDRAGCRQLAGRRGWTGEPDNLRRR